MKNRNEARDSSFTIPRVRVVSEEQVRRAFRELALERSIPVPKEKKARGARVCDFPIHRHD